MSNKQNILQTLKVALGLEAAPAPVQQAAPAAPTAYPCADGTSVEIDTLAVGGKVTTGGQPVPDGTITLQDGTIITVAGGVITALTPATPNEPVNDMATVMAAVNELKTQFNAFTQSLSDVSTKLGEFDAWKTEFEKTNAKNNGAIFQALSEISATPVDTPIDTPPVLQMSKIEKAEDRLKSIAKNLKFLTTQN